MPVRQKGDTARIYGTFTDIDGVAPAATIARLTVRAPSGTVTDYTYPGTVTRDSTGTYHYDVSLNAAGDWVHHWEFEMSAAIVAVSEPVIERVQAVP